MKAASTPLRDPDAARLLVRLERRLAALRRGLDRRRGACPAPPRRRLRFTPIAFAADRLVLTNTHAAPGFVRVGDMELELAAGESATFWVDAAAPAPETGDAPRLARPDRFLLSDDSAPIV